MIPIEPVVIDTGYDFLAESTAAVQIALEQTQLAADRLSGVYYDDHNQIWHVKWCRCDITQHWAIAREVLLQLMTARRKTNRYKGRDA